MKWLQSMGFTSLVLPFFLGAAALVGPQKAAAQDAPAMEEDAITGTMDINFATRTNPDTTGSLVAGSPAIGAMDGYNFVLRVAKTTEFAGSITRQPNLYSKTIRSRKQGAALGFNVNLAVLNPKDLKQKKVIGKLTGGVPIDEASGAFDLTGVGAKDVSPLRIVVDTVGQARGFSDAFTGKLVGRAEKKDNLAGYTYKRLAGGKTFEVKVAKVDPMKFQNIQLAKGPFEIYPRCTVNGSLDYDYETGNWITEGIRFVYSLDGKQYEDVVTGSIKFVEDPQRASNGKGYYDFNLRFNEASAAPAKGEDAAFANMSAEEAFFAVDNNIPALTGRIEYVDTFISGGTTPASSKVTYHLNANKLNKQQVMNFFKLWLLCIGPTNDE